jgi:TolB-like protein
MRSGSRPIDQIASDKHAAKQAAPASDPWESPRLPSAQTAAAYDASKQTITPIAVLPFSAYGENLGSTQLIADIITDDVTNTLSTGHGLRVISRLTARSYQETSMNIAAIGAELGVRYVLEGNVRMIDDNG